MERSGTGWLTLIAATGAALILRLACGDNALWLNGILSVDGAGRLSAILAGVLCVPVVWWVLQPWGLFAQKSAAILIAVSHVHVHCSFGTQPYSLQILFALLAFGFLERYHRLEKPGLAILFGLFCSLAVLSHTFAINFFLACLFWSVWFHRDRGESPDLQLRRLSLCHILPVTTIAVLFLANVRPHEIPGGLHRNPFVVAASAWSLIPGIAKPGIVGLICGAIAIGMVAATVALCRRIEFRQSRTTGNFSSRQWIFFLMLLFVIPGIRILTPGPALSIRYFFLPLTFGILLIAMGGSSLSRTGARRLMITTFGMLALVNVLQVAHSVRMRRDDCAAVVEAIVNETNAETVSIGSTGNIPETPVLEFIAGGTSPAIPQFRFVDPQSGPDWLIVHQPDDGFCIPPMMPREWTVGGEKYHLRVVSRGPWMPGFRWHCYRNQSSAPCRDRANGYGDQVSPTLR